MGRGHHTSGYLKDSVEFHQSMELSMLACVTVGWERVVGSGRKVGHCTCGFHKQSVSLGHRGIAKARESGVDLGL